jgi:hypothetical protein
MDARPDLVLTRGPSVILPSRLSRATSTISSTLRLSKISSVLVRPCHQHQLRRHIRSGISTAG